MNPIIMLFLLLVFRIHQHKKQIQLINIIINDHKFILEMSNGIKVFV